MIQKVKTLQLIHMAICAGVVLAYFFAGTNTTNFNELLNIQKSDFIYILIPIAAFFIGNFLFKNQLKSTDPNHKIEDKMGIYQTASIIRWAVLEFAVFFLIFIKPSLNLISLLLIIYLIFLRPTEEKITSELQNQI